MQSGRRTLASLDQGLREIHQQVEGLDQQIDRASGTQLELQKAQAERFTRMAKIRLDSLVSGEVKQDSTSEDMIFNIPEQIEYLSGNLTLLPGDVIATGTCAGVGHPTGTYLKDGDRIVIEIEGLGRLENAVATESR